MALTITAMLNGVALSAGLDMYTRTEPLTDLEMYDLIQAAYPGKFPDDINPDGAWEAVMEFAENLSGFDDVADLLGRVATLTMPMTTALSGELVHCLGKVDILEGKANMMAAVKRKVANAKLRCASND